MAADVFLQWKGTDVCLDFHCYACNTFAHFDGDFAYALECPTCGQQYEMPSVFALKPVEKGTIGSVQMPTEADRELREMGWSAAVPQGTCTYHSDKE